MENQYTKPKPKLIFQNFGQIHERLMNSEPPVTLWRGIVENTVGLMVGPAKSGKTTMCENLGISLAIGRPDFMGFNLLGKPIKVAFISFEEREKLRYLSRNKTQFETLSKDEQELMYQNFIMSIETPYGTASDILKASVDSIIETNANFVIIDSLTHLASNDIDKVNNAIEIMNSLKTLGKKINASIAIITHTPKMLPNQSLTLNSIGGSSVFGSQADYVIGVNRTIEGSRYTKSIVYRYVEDNEDQVVTFEIGEDKWLHVTGQTDEWRLLRSSHDGRNSFENRQAILEAIEQLTPDSDDGLVKTADIIAETGIKSATFYENIKKLMKEGKITSPKKGYLKLVEDKPNVYRINKAS